MLLRKLFAGRDARGDLPKLVMFDLDGTLVDSVPDLAAAVDSMLETLGCPPAGVEKVGRWVGNGAPMLVRRALADSCEGAVVETLTEADIARPLALFLAAYGDSATHLSRCYEGVEACLRALRDFAIPQLVVTNKPERFVAPILESLGLAPFIDWAVGGDSLAEKKPHPLPLLHCLERYGVNAGEALMVGDSDNDIRAARAAGVPVVAVSYGYNHGRSIADCGADAVVDDLRQLLV